MKANKCLLEQSSLLEKKIGTASSKINLWFTDNVNSFCAHALSCDDVKKAIKSLRNDCTKGHDKC